MGNSFCLPAKPFKPGLFVPIDRSCRKLIHESKERLLQRRAAQARFKPAECIGDQLGIDSPAIKLEKRMAQLVNESHGIESGRTNCA